MDDGELPRLLASNRQELPLELEPLLDVARRTLESENAARSELSLSFVGEEEMGELHARYMGEPGPTDVLSFPLDDEDEDGVRILGDVVVCPAVARRAANAYDAELRLLVVHGVLHLLGYDHEDDDERRDMFARQEALTGVRVR